MSEKPKINSEPFQSKSSFVLERYSPFNLTSSFLIKDNDQLLFRVYEDQKAVLIPIVSIFLVVIVLLLLSLKILNLQYNMKLFIVIIVFTLTIILFMTILGRGEPLAFRAKLTTKEGDLVGILKKRLSIKNVPGSLHGNYWFFGDVLSSKNYSITFESKFIGSLQTPDSQYTFHAIIGKGGHDHYLGIEEYQIHDEKDELVVKLIVPPNKDKSRRSKDIPRTNYEIKELVKMDSILLILMTVIIVKRVFTLFRSTNKDHF